jgi:hypothetical protein
MSSFWKAIFPLHFSRHFSPKPFVVFVKGLSQFAKYPFLGFVVFCRLEPGTELTDFAPGRAGFYLVFLADVAFRFGCGYKRAASATLMTLTGICFLLVDLSLRLSSPHLP